MALPPRTTTSRAAGTGPCAHSGASGDARAPHAANGFAFERGQGFTKDDLYVEVIRVARDGSWVDLHYELGDERWSKRVRREWPIYAELVKAATRPREEGGIW